MLAYWLLNQILKARLPCCSTVHFYIFSITFVIDEENDYISVSSDEELVQALNANATQTKCLKFYVQSKLFSVI